MLREHPEILDEINAIAAEYSVISEMQPSDALVKWNANEQPYEDAEDDGR